MIYYIEIYILSVFNKLYITRHFILDNITDTL